MCLMGAGVSVDETLPHGQNLAHHYVETAPPSPTGQSRADRDAVCRWELNTRMRFDSRVCFHRLGCVFTIGCDFAHAGCEQSQGG